jgi:hypothetical protein
MEDQDLVVDVAALREVLHNTTHMIQVQGLDRILASEVLLMVMVEVEAQLQE